MDKEEFQFLSENLTSKEKANILKSFNKQYSHYESNKKSHRKQRKTRSDFSQ